MIGCYRRLLLFALLLGPISVNAGCPAHGKNIRADDDWEDDEDDDARDRRRRRRRRRRRTRSRRSAAVLIQARRIAGAVVENSRSGRPREDLDELRQTLCEEREDDAVIFYQLVVSTQWHYYWLCSERRPQRAATPQGKRALLRWANALSRRAEAASAECRPGSRRRLFRETHESGTRARAYCDGRVVLSFPDGGKKTRYFTVAGAAAPPRRAARTRVDPGRSVCPVCTPCPTVSRPRDCPRPRPCPPPRQCPNPQAQIRAAQQKAFWQGVKKACKRICTMVYKKCRSINPKTALCYQVSEYCAENCAKK